MELKFVMVDEERYGISEVPVGIYTKGHVPKKYFLAAVNSYVPGILINPDYRCGWLVDSAARQLPMLYQREVGDLPAFVPEVDDIEHLYWRVVRQHFVVSKSRKWASAVTYLPISYCSNIILPDHRRSRRRRMWIGVYECVVFARKFIIKHGLWQGGVGNLETIRQAHLEDVKVYVMQAQIIQHLQNIRECLKSCADAKVAIAILREVDTLLSLPKLGYHNAECNPLALINKDLLKYCSGKEWEPNDE